MQCLSLHSLQTSSVRNFLQQGSEDAVALDTSQVFPLREQPWQQERQLPLSWSKVMQSGLTRVHILFGFKKVPEEHWVQMVPFHLAQRELVEGWSIDLTQVLFWRAQPLQQELQMVPTASLQLASTTMHVPLLSKQLPCAQLWQTDPDHLAQQGFVFGPEAARVQMLLPALISQPEQQEVQNPVVWSKARQEGSMMMHSLFGLKMAPFEHCQHSLFAPYFAQFGSPWAAWALTHWLLALSSYPSQQALQRKLEASKFLQLGSACWQLPFLSKKYPAEHLAHLPEAMSIWLQLGIADCALATTHDPLFSSYPAKQDRHMPLFWSKLLQVGSTPWHLPAALRKKPSEHLAQASPLKVLQLGSKLLANMPGRQVSSMRPKPGQQVRHAPLVLLQALQLGFTG